MSLMRPSKAYSQNTNRYAFVSDQFFAKSDCTIQPQIMVPRATPALPRSVYQAKMSVRRAVDVSWERVDSSIARKGPISLPLLRSVAGAT